MLSYKKWKQINENIGGTFTLGFGQPNRVADLHSRWDEGGYPMKKSKKMLGDVPEDDSPMGGPPMGGGPGGPPMLKKKKKPMPIPKDLGPSPEDEDEDLDDMGDDDMGDEDSPDDDVDDADMGDESPDEDDVDSDVDGDVEDDGEDMGGEDDIPTPPIMKKPPMKGGGFVGKTKAVADGAKMMHKGAQKMVKGMKESKEGCDCKCKKCKCGDHCKGCSKMMTKEEAEFYRSLYAQTGGTRFMRDEDGDFVAVQEDAIIPPSDPNAGLSDEPTAGEVGYAPQGRIGAIGSYAEWSNRHKKAAKKINESASKKKSWFG